MLIKLKLLWDFEVQILVGIKGLNSFSVKRSYCWHWNIYSVRQEQSWYLYFHKAKEPFSSWIQSRNYFSSQSLTWIKDSPSPMWSRSHRRRILHFHWTENRATAQRMWSYFQHCMMKAMSFLQSVRRDEPA